MNRCDDQILTQLLDDALSSEASRAASNHLDSCPRCRDRLLELAASEQVWYDTATALNTPSLTSSVVVAFDAELASDQPVQVDRVQLDFLDPPTHPEMLGRIGRYEVERLIGAGGMGIVLKAYDTELNRPVAVKVLAPHLAHSGGARQRFAREAQSAAAVVHDHVVPIFDVHTSGTLPYLVMQYVAGESLQARVDREGPLSPTEVLRIGLQIAAGLHAAHQQGLVHRDVKPANVLLESSVDRVMISDFGLARAADDASLTRSGVLAGTPHYMSPEQAQGEALDARSDLFGLGSVLYYMCTGHPPFRANGTMGVLHRICQTPHRPVDTVNPTVPADLADLIDHLLEKSPGRRPHDMESVAETLRRQISQRSHRPTRRAGWQGRWRRLRQRMAARKSSPSSARPIGVGSIVAGTCAVLLLLFAAATQWPAQPDNAPQQQQHSPALQADAQTAPGSTTNAPPDLSPPNLSPRLSPPSLWTPSQTPPASSPDLAPPLLASAESAELATDFEPPNESSPSPPFPALTDTATQRREPLESSPLEPLQAEFLRRWDRQYADLAAQFELLEHAWQSPSPARPAWAGLPMPLEQTAEWQETLEQVRHLEGTDATATLSPDTSRSTSEP